MLRRVAVRILVLSLAAAANGCADARLQTAVGGRGGTGDQNASGSAGLTPPRADADAGAGTEECPDAYPTLGATCRVPRARTCTYRGDGPCSPTNPDRIALCVGGSWVSVSPAIACNPPDAAAADGGGLDCGRPLKLADFCNRPGADCSASFRALRETYCDPMSRHFNTTLDANSCGGRTLVAKLGNSGMRYDFGPSDLISVQSWDDQPYGSCARHAYVYGEACELLGMERPACPGLQEEDAGQ